MVCLNLNISVYRVLGLPDTEYTEQLFNLMDVDESGQIDFREFITGALIGSLHRQITKHHYIITQTQTYQQQEVPFIGLTAAISFPTSDRNSTAESNNHGGESQVCF